MHFNIISKTITLPDGRTITLETGKLAKQADGSVVVRMEDTMLLATVVAAKEIKPGVDFLPLSVDYQEKFASAGRIPGSFQRREGRLSDHEVLVSRLVDRAIRPLFPEDYHAETQINIFLISADPNALPDALASLAATAALMASDIPFYNPVSEVRVAKINGEYVINPTSAALKEASIDLIVGATLSDITMVEGELNEASEEEVVEAIKVAHEAIKIQCTALKEFEAACGKTEKRSYEGDPQNEELNDRIRAFAYDRIYAVAQAGTAKHERRDQISAIKEELVASLTEGLAEGETLQNDLVNRYFHDLEWEAARRLVLDERKRLDGRKLDQVRPIASEVDYLPRAHGSALFTRGETQSLTTVTLGTKLDEQIVDSAMNYGYSRFLLHYNFPGFSTGEVKPNRSPGRREVGHGNLALRALKKVLPEDENNPYTIRIVSDILESNGSSSMATVCAGSLALMDSGLKVKGQVSGIAMGLISDAETGKYAILSDILGDEDHLGDMDFKVAGTAKGITACQMDIKVDGLSFNVLSEALQQAKAGRLHILGEMNKTLTEPRPDLKPHTPRAIVIRIEKDQIGAVIGPGGKVVQEIQKDSGATVNIEEKDNYGYVSIFSADKASMDKAVSRVKGIVAVPEVGEVYKGVVKSIMPFGAFVEFMPGKDGLLHISEIVWERLETVEGVLKVGEEVEVKLVEVDKKTGKFRLSRKVLLPRPENKNK
ncbi:polyribonucleotide nucleotidyltransferase [Ravibacter arvi]|uniref:Polyribonucleotide nucleotidyltransferase n=1 Tax=Ravibacter arvi TaxID=2051041 RepID=A0ABP8LQT4_9BACT